MEAWPSDWMRSVLQPAVLRLVADGPTYGYAIAQRLADAGLGTVKGGTLYPVLTRLEQQGLVTVQWRAGEGGPGRKYYEITDTGRTELAHTTEHWAAFTRTTLDLLGPGEPVELAQPIDHAARVSTADITPHPAPADRGP